MSNELVLLIGIAGAFGLALLATTVALDPRAAAILGRISRLALAAKRRQDRGR